MAKLKAHGTELARFEYANGTIVCMSDGHTLRNRGDGWKLFRKVKPGVDPVYAAEIRRNSFNKRRDACPIWARYVDLLAQTVSRSDRWKLNAAIEIMATDADGVWATLHDEGIHLDVSEVVELCELYETGSAEVRAYILANPPKAS